MTDHFEDVGAYLLGALRRGRARGLRGASCERCAELRARGRAPARRRRRAARVADPDGAAARAQGPDHGRRQRRGRAAARRRAARPTARRSRAAAQARGRRAAAGLVVAAPGWPRPRCSCWRSASSARVVGSATATRRARSPSRVGNAKLIDARQRALDADRRRTSSRRAPGQRLPGVAAARGQGRARSRPTRCSAPATTARRRSTSPARSRTSSRCSSPRSPRAARRRRRRDRSSSPPGIAGVERRPLASAPRMADVLPPSRPRDGRLLLELRQPDLPGLHDADAGRHALPGVLEADDEGRATCARSTTRDRGVTIGLIAINVLVFFGMSSQSGFGSAGGRLFGDFALVRARGRRASEYYRLITSGFLHSGFLHIGFNMYILWFLGHLLEPSLGPVRFLAPVPRLAAVRLVLGAAARSPNAVTVGASGAIFGLMGAAFVMQRARGIDPMQSGIGPIILLNLAIGFIVPNISIGGHIGGLVGGALVGFLMDQVARFRQPCDAGGGGGARRGGRGGRRPSRSRRRPRSPRVILVGAEARADVGRRGRAEARAAARRRRELAATARLGRGRRRGGRAARLAVPDDLREPAVVGGDDAAAGGRRLERGFGSGSGGVEGTTTTSAAP